MIVGFPSAQRICPKGGGEKGAIATGGAPAAAEETKMLRR